MANSIKKSTLLVIGFIGSNFIHYLFNSSEFFGKVVNYDNLTYAGNEDNLKEIIKKQKLTKFFVNSVPTKPTIRAPHPFAAFDAV